MPRLSRTGSLRWVLLVLFFLSLLVPSIAHGQTLTTVTGVITDPQGFIYTGARITVTLNGTTGVVRTTPCPGNNQAPGCSVQLPTPFFTDALTGKFTINLWANAGITCTPTACAGTTYTFTVDSYNATANPPIGTGPQHFAVSGITIAGSSQDISSTLSAAAPSLTNINPASVTGCGLPAGGVQFGILEENPKGTCFDSSLLTWNPTNSTFVAGSNTVPAAAPNNTILGPSNTISLSAGSAPGNIYWLGSGNQVQQTATGSAVNLIYMMADSSGTTCPNGQQEGTNGSTGNIFDVYFTGAFNCFYVTGASTGNTLADVFANGYENYIYNGGSTLSTLRYVLASGFNNSLFSSGNATFQRMGAWGFNDTVHDCSDCYAIGENAAINTSNVLGIGLSATPELQITPNVVKTSPSAAMVVGNITPGTSPICPNGTGGALTTAGCSGGTGGAGSGGVNLLYANATPVTVSNTTAETTLMQYTIPANTVTAAGQDVHVVAAGANNNSSGANANYVYKLYLDSTVIATHFGTNAVTGDKNTFWHIDADMVFSAVGASGAAKADGTVIVEQNSNGFIYPATQGATNVTLSPLDTTASHTLKVTVTLGTAATTVAPSQDRMLVTLDSGGSVSVNGTALNTPNFNSTAPAAPAGNANCTWQFSGSNVSCYSFDTLAGLQGGVAPSGQTYDFTSASLLQPQLSTGLPPTAEIAWYPTTQTFRINDIGSAYPVTVNDESGSVCPSYACWAANIVPVFENAPGAPKDSVIGNSTLAITPNSTNTSVSTFDISHITANRTYTFPDATGTLCLTSTCTGSPGGATDSFQYNNAGAFGGIAAAGYAGVPQIPSEVTGSAPTVGPQGVPIATAITASGPLPLTARGQLTPLSSATAATLTLPAAGSTNFDASFPALLCNSNTGTWTFTSTSTIFVWSGSSYGSVASPTLTTGQCANLFSDNTSWYLKYGPGPTSGSGIANSTFTTGTTLIAANSCTAVSTVTMTGATTSTAFFFNPTTDASAVTGWGSTGGLMIEDWPTANTFNFKVCNQTASSITPGATLTWNVGAR